MKDYQAKYLRNIALVGHGGEGKTTLTEAFLFASGTIDRMGTVEDGSATTDYDPEEVKRSISISTAVAPLEWKNHKITLIDIPGYFDFIGEMGGALSAARLALKKCVDASPCLLEPVYKLEVTVPDEYMGDVIGDMNRRRGRIMGMDQVEGGQKVTAEVPLSEVFKYATDLRAMTQARGSFVKEFVRYEEVPAQVAAKIIANAKLDDDEE